jgi:hypothetical protein
MHKRSVLRWRACRTYFFGLLILTRSKVPPVDHMRDQQHHIAVIAFAKKSTRQLLSPAVCPKAS